MFVVSLETGSYSDFGSEPKFACNSREDAYKLIERLEAEHEELKEAVKAHLQVHGQPATDWNGKVIPGKWTDPKFYLNDRMPIHEAASAAWNRTHLHQTVYMLWGDMRALERLEPRWIDTEVPTWTP